MTDTELTGRQRDVLRLTQEGKNPTEIGQELGISSQGVHGHLRRLRSKGLIAREGGKRVVRAANARPVGPPAPFDPASTMSVVIQTITAQLAALDERERQVDAEIEGLREEKRAIGTARKDLQKLIPQS